MNGEDLGLIVLTVFCALIVAACIWAVVIIVGQYTDCAEACLRLGHPDYRLARGKCFCVEYDDDVRRAIPLGE